MSALRIARLLLALCALAREARAADAGTLIPKDKQAPDAAILSLEEMNVEVVIDNGDAHVTIVQIFANHTNAIEEGTYRFALPTGSTVSDFAVWDGPVRIPAVILERKRAEQVYDQARLQAIDPGLLEGGERDHLDPKNTALFSAKIVPIPAYGTKRLELEYHQRVTTTDLQQFFALPLKPDAGAKQLVHHFKLHFVLSSAHAVANVQTPSKLFPLTLTNAGPHSQEGTFEANDVSLDEDFQANWKLSADAADKLEVITYRNPAAPLPDAGAALSEGAGRQPARAEPGFFAAELLVGEPGVPGATAAAAVAAPRTVVLLFDNSLSMQWEKLERSYAALEAVLRSLRPGDRFNVLLFNQGVSSFEPQTVAADATTVERALAFVRASKLRGGTDLAKALAAGLAQSTDDHTTLVLLTDGGSDRGETVVPGKIAAQYATRWKQSAHPPAHGCACGGRRCESDAAAECVAQWWIYGVCAFDGAV